MLQTLTMSRVVDVGLLTRAAVGSVQSAGTRIAPTVESTHWARVQLGYITRTTDAPSASTTT